MEARMKSINQKLHSIPLSAVFILAVFSLISISCAQSPVFFEISKETEPKVPTIKGSPSKLVQWNNAMYTANGSLWKFDGTAWTIPAGAPSDVRDIAATTNGSGGALYALSISSSSGLATTLRKTTDGINWVEVVKGVSGYANCSTIYGAGSALFVGAGNSGNDDWAILYDDNNTLKSVKTNMGADKILRGAALAGSTYYLAVSGIGIYHGASAASAVNLVSGTADAKYQLNGLIAVGGKFTAVGKGGHLLIGDSAGTTEHDYSTDYKFTGALAAYSAPGATVPDLLLAGIEKGSTGLIFGYREIALTSGALPSAKPDLREPGTATPSTLRDTPKYAASMGKQPVQHLFQFQPPAAAARILFGSTVTNGLWSYRNDEWNAEN